MSAFDTLMKQDAFTSTDDKGGNLQWIDADTFVDADKQKHRLQRVDAPETLHGGPEEGEVQAGGAATHAATVDLARKMGYTKVVNSGEKDKYGRFLSDLVHPETGESFTKNLANEGVIPIDHRFDKNNENLKDREYTQALKTVAKRDETYVETEWDQAKNQIDDALLAETKGIQNFQRAQQYSGEVGDIQAQLKTAKEEGNDELVRRLDDRLATISQRANADTIHKDRDQITGMANDPLSVAWDQGWNGAREGAYGFLELLGETTGIQSLEDTGTAGIVRAQNQNEEYAKILTDWKDVDGFGTGVSFLANNALMSLPYMAITAGAAVGGTIAAPLIGGVAAGAAAIAAPASIYAGQVWNEMEGEKSAAVALTAGLAQAALDRIGLGAITGKFVPGKITGLAVKKIMKANGVSKSVAEATLANATKQELAGFLKDSAAIATKQIADKKLGMELIKKTSGAYATGAGGEAITEAGQELIGYFAATQGSDKEFEWSELNQRLIAAGIAGGALGGAFATPGGVKKALADYDTTAQQAAAQTENDSQASVFAAEEEATYGRVRSVEEIAAHTRVEAFHAPASSTLEDRANAGESNYKKLSATQKVVQALLNPAAALEGAVENTITADVEQRSPIARELKSLLGGRRQRVHAGSSFENAKHHRTSKWKNMVPRPETFWAGMSQGKRVTKHTKGDLNKAVYSQINAAVDSKGNFDPDLLVDGPQKQMLVTLASQVNQLGSQMHSAQKEFKKDLGFTKNYLFKYKAVNKVGIHKDRAGFAALLQSEYNYSPADAKQLTEILAEDPNAADVGEAFSIAKGGLKSAAHKERSLALSENPKFQAYMEQDIFSNIDQAVKQASRYVTNEQYLGKDNAVISKMLEKMQKQDGLSEAEVDKIAAGVKDFLDAESGNYKRPTSAAGKKLQKMQKSAMTLMTLSGLPLATLSSLVEVALVNKSLTNEQIFGAKGSLKAIGTEGSRTIMQAVNDVGNFVARKEQTQRPVTSGQSEIENLGFTDWDVGAGTVAGVTEVNAHQQKLYQDFFKVIGLSQFTDFTRAARAAIGGDYINAKIEILANHKNNGQPETREVQEAREAIRNLGIDANLFMQVRDANMSKVEVDPETQAAYDAQLREGMFTWVNDAVALPQSANRPLIYQDPRFALFTQFQGFIATFTANHIPRMWGEQVKRGTPAMKYSAFATMATMVMLGFLSQAMKDEIKYGLDDEEDETAGNPHLKTADYVRRGVFSSGLFGTAERAISFVNPIYDSKSANAGDWAFDSAIGESPALSYIQRIGGAGSSLLEGDVGKAAKQGFKSLPYVGPASFASNWVEEAGDNWNFNGE